MKVVHINLQKNWRGGEQQLAYLIEGLQALGQQQILVCRKGTDLEAYAISKGIVHHTLETGMLQKYSSAKAIKRLIAQHKPAVIHCHESKGHGLTILAKMIWGFSPKIVLHRRVLFPISGWYSKNVKYSSRYVDQVICVSQAVEKLFVQTTQNSKTAVIADMADLEFPYQSGNLLQQHWGIQAKKTIGYIAALTFEKDHMTFLNTAKVLADADAEIEFIIVGSGKLEANIQAYAQAIGLTHRVHFLGYVDQAKKLIPEIDVLLFTSTQEGLGSTILDFFVAQKPVVTVKNGGSEDLVQHGQTGFICELKQVECLAKYCLKLLNDKELSAQITENAAVYVREQFSIETICKQTLAVYQSLAKSN